jgi:hypothetical protein
MAELLHMKESSVKEAVERLITFGYVLYPEKSVAPHSYFSTIPLAISNSPETRERDDIRAYARKRGGY